MTTPAIGLLRFDEGYFERLWAGQKLRTLYGKPIPTDKPIGEAWLISDHPVHESAVAEGPLKGHTLRTLLERDAEAILGSHAALTPDGRFPLLLKLLDAADTLSVQVHPDDDCARRLGEPDVGKTEMWHVLQADPGAELICGLSGDAVRETFAARVLDGSVEALMRRHPATEGASLYVPAGTVHAIGRGQVLAEIQQNSDLTYRLYDWGRLDDAGKPRALHVEKALEAIHLPAPAMSLSRPLQRPVPGGRCEVLAACRYFAAERLDVATCVQLAPERETFRILLGVHGTVQVSDAGGSLPLSPGNALLVPASSRNVRVEGQGSLLHYYVPDAPRDLIEPLQRAGHSMDDIRALGDL